MSLTYEEYSKLVEDVYDFRDAYFQNHKDGTDETKKADVISKANEVIRKIEESSQDASNETGMRMSFLKAKALNVLEEYNPDAEKMLTKYVKLYPRHIDAWNVLGDVFWKKKDYYNARNCFESSLKMERNVSALRFLSMLLRQDPDSENIKESFDKSIELAREAVNLNLQCGLSWYVLGNTYLSSFFKFGQEKTVLKQALKAYSSAGQQDDVMCNPDFHYNRALACTYDQDYGKALTGFERALECKPSWEHARNHFDSLTFFLNSVCKSIANKGNIKNRKLKELLKSFNPKHLGMYVNGVLKKQGEGLVNVPLILTKLDGLVIGINSRSVVMGKVVCQVFAPEHISFTFCMIDNEANCIAVNVYNMAQGKGVIVGDSVAIPEPLVEEISVTYKEKSYNFRWIRIDDPLVIVVNGRKLKADWKAVPVLQSVFKAD